MMTKIAKKARSLADYIKCVSLYYIASFVSLFVRNKPFYKDLWLISERGTDARDNGYHFFKYLCKNCGNINCVYLIDKKSPDYNKVKDLGKVLQPGSFKHYIAFACAKAKISTHIMGYAPDTYRFTVLDKKFRLVRGKKIFLQHGIIKDNIFELHYPAVNLDLFICSTMDEFKSVIDGYNYPAGIVQRLGLCRYDALLAEHDLKRQILVMPTWRYYLRELDDEGFKKSEYYQCFNGLISDQGLHKMLEETDYELVLYLHYELQKFTKLFCGNNDRIKVKGMGDADVQKLLMESSMLITDYSSVFFDFAYMKKPLAYWQFDRDLFFAEQYGQGYFSFYDDGFGPVCTKKEEVIDYIAHELKTDMKVENLYEDRTNRAFSEFSKDHCKKTFEAITKLF